MMKLSESKKKLNFLEKLIIKYEKFPFPVINNISKLTETALRYFMFNAGYTPDKLIYEHQVSSLDRDLVKKINSLNSILLITFPKSGTNWLMFMISNYLYSIKNIDSTNLSLSEKSEKVFNYRNGIIWMNAKIQTSFQLNEKENSYLFFQHINSAIDNAIYFQGKRILLYRNPRDWIISWHEYFGKRLDIIYRPKKISHAIDYLLPNFCKWYNFMKKINIDDNDIMVSYENLIKDTETILKKILIFLDLEINDDMVHDSIIKSSVNQVNNEESQGNKVHKDIKLNNRDYFIRNPKIGQWNEYFKKAEIEKIDNFLLKKGINPSEFVYE